MLKIDRSFVAGMDQHRESRQIVRTILRLANSLGMRVVAEGVERLQQASALRELGCEFGQGYLFAKPLKEADADEFARRPRRTPAAHAHDAA